MFVLFFIIVAIICLNKIVTEVRFFKLKNNTKMATVISFLNLKVCF